jgi:hypothetical protein
VTITAAKIVNAGATFNGVGLGNDAKVLDLQLTLHIVDGGKVFDQTVNRTHPARTAADVEWAMFTKQGRGDASA